MKTINSLFILSFLSFAIHAQGIIGALESASASEKCENQVGLYFQGWTHNDTPK